MTDKDDIAFLSVFLSSWTCLVPYDIGLVLLLKNLKTDKSGAVDHTHYDYFFPFNLEDGSVFTIQNMPILFTQLFCFRYDRAAQEQPLQ